VLATGAAAALPVLIAIVRALADGWMVEGDQAIIATRAYDVLTSESPLVGPWSTSSVLIDEPTFSAGPLLYWLLAVPSRLPGVAAFPLTMGVVNIAAVMGVVALADRRGGRPLMFATAGAVALMCASLKTEVLTDPWAPTAPLILFTLLIFVCWSVACGDHRLLPLAVLIASFASQCHLMLLLPSVGLLGVAVLGLVAGRRNGAPSHEDGRSLRRWSLAAVIVAMLCWSGPLADQALAWAGSDRGYGNLVHLEQAARARGPTIGEKGGVHAVARAVGVPPWWLRPPQPEATRLFEVFGWPKWPAFVSAVVVLAGLVGCSLAAVRRRRGDVVAACACALVLCAALAAVTASFPTNPQNVFIYGYTSYWGGPAGMFAWLVLCWSAATLWWPRRTVSPLVAPRVATAVALGGVLVVAAAVAAGQSENTQQGLYAPIRTAVERVENELPSPRSVRVDGTNLQIGTAVVFALRRRGATVGLDLGEQFGRSYEPANRRYDDIVDIRQGVDPPRGARLVTRVRLPPPGSTYTVSLRPGPRGDR
jgi:hypothetical protein